MIRPTIFIGLGGSGCKVVQRLEGKIPDDVKEYCKFLKIDSRETPELGVEADNHYDRYLDETNDGLRDFHLNRTGQFDNYSTFSLVLTQISLGVSAGSSTRASTSSMRNSHIISRCTNGITLLGERVIDTLRMRSASRTQPINTIREAAVQTW